MQAIIPVAGQGRRLASVTRGRPKALLEVGGCTLVEHSLQRAQELGATEVILVVRGPVVAGHLGSRWHDLPLRYMEQSPAGGLGHAVRSGAPALTPAPESQPFLVICGDTWRSQPISPAIAQRFQRDNAMLNLVTASPAAQLRHSAAVVTDGGDRILQVEEKPPATRPGLAEAGIYRFPQAVLQAPVHRESGGEETLQSMTNWLIRQGHPCLAVLYSGDWVNVNTPDDLALARRQAAGQEGQARPWSPKD